MSRMSQTRMPNRPYPTTIQPPPAPATSPVETACCALAGPTKPHFYCGQLLTDQNLSDLVDWARDRFRFRRFHEGWGVVCGLDLWSTPSRPGTLVVGPGYAVNVCGDDVVVPAPTSFDFGSLCLPGGVGGSNCGCVPAGDVVVVPDAKPLVFDVYLRYDEQPLDPQPAPRRGCSTEPTGCASSRTRESFTIAAVYNHPTASQPPAEYDAWNSAYVGWAQEITTFLGNLGGSGTAEQISALRQVRHRYDDHGATRYPWIPEAIQQGIDTGKIESGDYLLWLGASVLDERAGVLGERCPACQSGAGVPLGRVWVEPADVQKTGTSCKVSHIAAFPPYRRPIAPAAPWPAPPGYVNLGRFLGLPWATQPDDPTVVRVTGWLARHGIRLAPAQAQTFGNVSDVVGLIQPDRLIARAGSVVTPVTFDLDRRGPVVVGFRIAAPTAAPQPGGPPPTGTGAAPAETGLAPDGPGPAGPARAGAGSAPTGPSLTPEPAGSAPGHSAPAPSPAAPAGPAAAPGATSPAPGPAAPAPGAPRPGGSPGRWFLTDVACLP